MVATGGQIERRSADGPVQFTGDRQHGIPPRFHFQSPPIHSPQESIFGIDFGGVTAKITTLLVRGR